MEVGVHEAKTTLSRLLKLVAAGETVTITSRGTPVARLVPAVAPVGDRELGQDRGEFRLGPEFDEPLPAEIMAAFE